MGYVDNERLNRWKWKGSNLTRRRPLRLVDREGIAALLEAVQPVSPAPYPSIILNGMPTDGRTIEEIVAKMPRRVLELFAYGQRGSVILSSKRSGSTVVYGAAIPDATNILVAALEDHGRPLSVWSRFLWWLPLVREQPVASGRRRDEVDDRAENRRNVMISALFGLLGGVIGGVATVYAAWWWGATP